MDLKGAVVVVAGGANGLGAATVEMAVEQGAKVGILDLPGSDGLQMAEKYAESAFFTAADVRDHEQVDAAFDAITGAFGEVDVCVATAGITTTHRMIKRSGDLFPPDLFRRTIEINLLGTFHVNRAAVASMVRKGAEPGTEAGVLVNTASIAAFDGQRGQIAYTASKAAIHGMALPLARDLGQFGIRVMSIAPGIMGTKMLFDFPEDLQARLVQDHIFPNRPGKPEEFASLVRTIVENPLLNGETIRLDAAARLNPA